MATSEKNLMDETVPITVRFPKFIVGFVDEVAEGRGNTDRSAIIREGVYRFLADLGYLSDENKKALGITNQEKL